MQRCLDIARHWSGKKSNSDQFGFRLPRFSSLGEAVFGLGVVARMGRAVRTLWMVDCEVLLRTRIGDWLLFDFEWK